MPSHRAITILLGFLLLTGGCSRAVAPLAHDQEQFFAQVTAADPIAERALKYAKYYSIAGRYDLAVAELEAPLQKEPHNNRLLNALGSLYDQMGHYRQAQEAYLKILARDADNPLALNNLGYSHYLAGNLTQAEKILQELLAKHPENTVARNNLGLIWCRQGRQQEALALWEEKDGPMKAQTKLQQVLAFLRGGSVMGSVKPASQIAAVPPQPSPAPAGEAPGKPAATAPTLPSHPLAAAPPPKEPQHTAPVAKASVAAAAPPVKVEEVTMIIQPASFTPSAATSSPAARPMAPKTAQPVMALPAAQAESDDEIELTTMVEPPVSRPWRRTPRYRMITASALEPPKTVKPLREYINRTHSHQSLNTPANPELAVY